MAVQQKNTIQSEEKRGRLPETPKPSPAAPQKKSTQEQIARRAYEIYQARGGEHGRSQEDWFQAERELTLGKH